MQHGDLARVASSDVFATSIALAATAICLRSWISACEVAAESQGSEMEEHEGTSSRRSPATTFLSNARQQTSTTPSSNAEDVLRRLESTHDVMNQVFGFTMGHSNARDFTLLLEEPGSQKARAWMQVHKNATIR